MSGKGGVGKTTVAVNLAYSLAMDAKKVGMMDADIHGPNVPKMVGVEDEKLTSDDGKINPVEILPNLSMVSVAYMIEKETSVIWRGPMKHGLIKQFIEDVNWPDIEYLVIDFPPGTGDECLSAIQILRMQQIRNMGAIIVSTPQKVSILDSVKSIDFCKKMNVKVIGLVENMSGGIFGKDTIKEIAKEYDKTFLGALTMNETISKSSDYGKPFCVDTSQSKSEFQSIVEGVKAYF